MRLYSQRDTPRTLEPLSLASEIYVPDCSLAQIPSLRAAPPPQSLKTVVLLAPMRPSCPASPIRHGKRITSTAPVPI